eukprot:CAMPEP_0202348324 /NCGR_PEP_ID=MMETSP1126-20121109/6303_1 /ASSEMBLY_ACC=CAM_ASM_000457 /TAXON_ID=3047 /ORGANISM="Dunaliella tertiolecta, Strain CCMP1320" /LENGTH=447 /DNA_ID=CAMNT_0048939995 /DNA_START=284 /DNA_END=1627 /DNA_ORIENTATION=-
MRVIPGHKVILASCSKYFEANIKRKMDGSMSGLSDTLKSSPEAAASIASVAELSKAQGKLLLVERCESPADLKAAEACLRTMYLQKSPFKGMPSSWDLEEFTSFLLKVARWADLWQAECMSGSCVAALKHLTKATSFEARHLNKLLGGLPEFLISSSAPARAQVMQVCSQWLLRKFKDVYEVVTVEKVRHAFCGLCAEAVSMWAKQDDLYGCENDVAIALAYWSNASGLLGQACSKEEVFKDLSLSLRVPQLTTTFRALVLPQLPFFTEGLHKDLVIFNFLASESKLGLGFKHVSCKWRSAARTGKANYSFAKVGLLGSVKRWQYTWTVLPDDIRQARSSPKMLEPALYVKGFLLRASLAMDDNSLHVHVAPGSNGVIPAPLGVYAKMEITAGSSTSSSNEVWVDGGFRSSFSLGFGGWMGDPIAHVQYMLDSSGNLPIGLQVKDVR